MWRLGPAVAEYHDPLGLAVTRTEPSAPGARFTVRPRTPAAVPWVAEAAAAHASGAARLDTDEAFEIHGMRRYVPGDDLRLVDWRSTLRTGTFHVRERRGGGSAPAVVLLDTAAGDGEAFETAVDCAAAVALSVLRLDRPVTLAGPGGAPRRFDPAPGAPEAVLDLLARVRPRAGASVTPLARLAAGMPGGALAVLATTRDPALWRPALSALSAHRATVVCLHATPPAPGTTRASTRASAYCASPRWTTWPASRGPVSGMAVAGRPVAAGAGSRVGAGRCAGMAAGGGGSAASGWRMASGVAVGGGWR